jgi:Flp pilus assembly protein TadD
LPGPKEHASAKALYQAGMDLLRAKNFGGARQKFELAGRIVPDPQTLAMPLVCNGFQFLRLGVADQARQAFARALLLSANCAEAKDGLAQVNALPKPG